MKKFTKSLAERLDATKYLYLRSGTEHRFIAVWVVMVDGRALVRSWNDKRSGWYRAFLGNPLGEIRLSDKIVRVRAVPVRSRSLIERADEEYALKYTTPANLRYVRGFATAKRRKTSLELQPR